MTKRLTEAEREMAAYGSRTFAGTFMAGYRAGCAGKPKADCPYDGARNNAYRRAWHNGFKFGQREVNRRS